MTITINTTTVTRSVIIFTAGVMLSDKIKKFTRKIIKKKTDKVKSAVNKKSNDIRNDINRRLHKAVDICFSYDGELIDVPIVWRSYIYETT